MRCGILIKGFNKGLKKRVNKAGKGVRRQITPTQKPGGIRIKTTSNHLIVNYMRMICMMITLDNWSN